MKNNKLSNIFKGVLAAGLGSAILISSGCDISKLQDAADDFAVVIGLKEINTNSTVMVTDTKTGELIEKKVSVVYNGPNGDNVIDIYSDPMRSGEFEGGVLNFGIENSIVPTDNEPTRVDLKLTAPGYISSTRSVTIADTGNSVFEISMMSEKNLPEGVKSEEKTQGSTNTDGSTTQDIEVEVNSDDSEEPASGMNMRIAKGTTLKDASGNVLKGALKSTTRFFDPGDEDAVSSLPIEEVVDKDGNSYHMAGASMMEITDENGNTAVSIESQQAKRGGSANLQAEEGTFEVEFKVPEDLEGQDYDYQLIAYDGDTPVVVNPTASHSKIRGDNSTQFHSRYRYFRFRWYPRWVYFVYRPPTCTGRININRNGNEGFMSYRVYTYGSMRRGTFYPWSNSSRVYRIRRNARSSVYINLPNGAPIQVSHNFCASGPLTVNLPAPPPTLINSRITGKLTCDNPNEKLRVTDIPSASVTYRKLNAQPGTSWKVATNLKWDYDENEQVLTGGSFNVSSVEPDKMYRFRISFDGQYHERDIRVTGTEVTFSKSLDSGVCS